jgi:hypothetical protein
VVTLALAAPPGAGGTACSTTPGCACWRARRKRLRGAGLESAATPPRQIANLVTTRFGPDARALADWLLKLEAQRYARAAGASLPRCGANSNNCLAH